MKRTAEPEVLVRNEGEEQEAYQAQREKRLMIDHGLCGVLMVTMSHVVVQCCEDADV